MCGVGFEAHSSASTEALLASPEFAINETDIDRQSSGDAGDHGYQSLSVRFAGRVETQHKEEMILNGFAKTLVRLIY